MQIFYFGLLFYIVYVLGFDKISQTNAKTDTSIPSPSHAKGRMKCFNCITSSTFSPIALLPFSLAKSFLLGFWSMPDCKDFYEEYTGLLEYQQTLRPFNQKV